MSSESSLSIIILVDGLGWSLVQQTGFLIDLLPHRGPATPPSGYSSAAIPALLTGLPPSTTGKWLLFARRRSGPGRLHNFARLASIANRNVSVDFRLRRWVRWWCIRMRRWPPHFSLYQIPFTCLRELAFEDTDMGWAPRQVRGSPTLFPKIEASGQRLNLFGYPTQDERTLDTALEIISAGESGVCILYLWQLDSAFHSDFHDSARRQTAVDRYAEGIRRLHDAARARHQHVNIAIVSDHGMTPVAGGVDVAAFLNECPVIRQVGPFVFYNSTLVQVWCDDRSALPRLRDALAGIPHGSLLSEERLRGEGVWFEDRRFGDLFVLMDEGWVVQPCFFGDELPSGMHGYDPTLPDSQAICLTNVDVGRPTDLREVHDALVRLAARS